MSKKNGIPAYIRELLKKKGAVGLDLGCGEEKQAGFIGMDKRDIPGVVDIVHDIEAFPWPLPDDCIDMIVASHIIEHLKPWLRIDFFNECWRVLKPGKQMCLSAPYGVGFHFIKDPTHVAPVNEGTFMYFDRRTGLWPVYKPKPWEIEKGFPQWQNDGSIECLMKKVQE